jgi:hypothetical protein
MTDGHKNGHASEKWEIPGEQSVPVKQVEIRSDE